MSKFYESLKSLFYDIELFLSTTLKDVKLPKAAATEKEAILRKLVSLEDEFPQLKVAQSAPQAEPLPITPVTTVEQVPEPRKKPASNIVGNLADHSDGGQEIYDAIGGEAEHVGESEQQDQDPYKASSSTSDVSELASVFISATDAMAICAISGMLVKKNVSKSKVDVKSLFMPRGKKFCVVTSGLFYMFDKPSSKKQCSSFPLRGYEARASADQAARKEFLFELVNPGQKTHVFAAASADEMQQWISVLTSEATKIPDPRTSVIFEPGSADNDSDSYKEDYEDPDDEPKPVAKGLPSPPKGKEQPHKTADKQLGRAALPPPPVDQEIYDDVGVPTESVDVEELYTDAQGQLSTEDGDDLIYECFDDISVPAAPVTAAAPAKTGTSSSLPVLPSREKQQEVGQAAASIPQFAADDATDTDDCENMFYGKWQCKPDGDNELEFKHGDIIHVLSREYDHFGWWVGKLNGKVGLVPREYLTPAYELVSG
jgi:src kinase associated phosphoprotein 1